MDELDDFKHLKMVTDANGWQPWIVAHSHLSA